jgi:hypothetical protein
MLSPNEGKEATVAAPFSFNKDVLADAIRRIYKKEIDPDREIDEGMFEETLRIINKLRRGYIRRKH